MQRDGGHHYKRPEKCTVEYTLGFMNIEKPFRNVTTKIQLIQVEEKKDEKFKSIDIYRLNKLADTVS